MLELILIFGFIALDQFVKYVSMLTLPYLPGMTQPLLEGVFHFTYAQNTGAAFGIFKDQLALFCIIPTLVSVALSFFLARNHKALRPMARISLSLILAGALGNLIDRFAFGYVRDMFDFRAINFAIFNVADICVTLGTVLFIICVLFSKQPDLKQALLSGHQKSEPVVPKAPDAGQKQPPSEPLALFEEDEPNE